MAAFDAEARQALLKCTLDPRGKDISELPRMVSDNMAEVKRIDEKLSAQLEGCGNRLEAVREVLDDLEMRTASFEIGSAFARDDADMGAAGDGGYGGGSRLLQSVAPCKWALLS